MPKVLVVDDETEIRQMLLKYLKGREFVELSVKTELRRWRI